MRFKFENQKLIQYLEERAKCLRSPLGMKGITDLNEKFQKFKDENLNDFIMDNLRPTRAFVTFKWQEGANDAESCLRRLYAMSKSKDADEQAQLDLLDFNGKRLRVLYRCEPTDIIWENQKPTGCKRCRLLFCIFTTSMLLAFFFFMVVFLLKAKSLQLKKIFPGGQQCSSLYQNFRISDFKAESEELRTLKRVALHEFGRKEETLLFLNEKFLQSLLKETQDRFHKSMACYCHIFELKKSELKMPEDAKAMCTLLDSLGTKLKYSSTVLGLFIAIVNFIFRTLLIEFAYLLKPSTFTGEMNQMKSVIFFVSFLNSGLLIILMSAYTDAPWLSIIFRGQYADFTPEWFNDIGQIIKINLFTNALYPLIELVMY